MSGPIAWFARNHVAANLLMLAMVLGGLLSLPRIHQRIFPDINVEVIQIGVPYLGAAPEEVEEGVCVRIEEEIHGIQGIEKITSTAAEGSCGVSAELLSGYSVDRALSEIKNAVDSIATFPAETEKPVVSHYAIRRNALQIALSGDLDERSLKTFGQRVRDDIAALPGVTQVELKGARSYEISIEVPEESLRRHGITFSDVVSAVRRSSLDLPGGSIKTSGGEILLRTKGQAYTGHEFESIVVLTRNDGTRLRLGEVARVVDGFEEDDRLLTFNGEPAVLIQVFRVGDQKVLELVETVKEFIGREGSRLPEGLHLTLWRDGSQSLRDRLDILIRNGLGGFVLVFVVLALFLRLRLAFWVSLGVPIAFLGALAMFPAFGLSIDVISLFAFILVLGLLVDDAIVVGESIHSHQERHEDPLQSAITGTREVSVPVIFGVLTSVAAFLPMIAAPGAMGQIFGGIGVVVVVCLAFSLIESQWVLPAHLGHSRSADEQRNPPRPGSVQARWKAVQAWFASSLHRLADRGYRRALDRALHWRYATLAFGVVLLIWTLAIAGAGNMRFSFFPEVESDYVSARLTMPLGSPVEATAQAVSQLEAAALRLKDDLDLEFPASESPRGEPVIKHVLASVGGQPSASRSSSVASSRSHLGEVSVELHASDGRPLSGKEVGARWRQLAPPIPDAVELTFSSSYFSAGDPINLQLQSSDVEDLRAAAERLKGQLARYPGVVDIADSFRDGKEEIVLSILPSAEVLGLTLADLARQVRQAFYGEEAQRIQREREDVRVMIRYPRDQRRSLGDLEELRIRTPSGTEVPFSTVARAEPGRGYASIRRGDRQRILNVTADVDESQGNANQIMRELRASLLPELRADFPGLTIGLEGAQREQAKLLGGLVWSYGSALLLIYALLAIPLRSYAQPLIIMAVIPFGLVGAAAGHLLMGLNASMMSIFGVVALSGVVVNASLVLVHTVNRRRARGLPIAHAVREAGVVRFRPIVLTSITTFAGLAPLLLETSVTARFLIPMATSLAFGVLFATGITLFLVPCSYLVLEDLRALVSRRRPGETPALAALDGGGEGARGADERRGGVAGRTR